MRLSLALCCAVLVCPSVLRAQAVQRVTVFDDVFADSERLTQSLPTSTAWFQNATASAAATQAGNLAVRNGVLILTVANASRAMWSHFPAVDLKIGERIMPTLEFRLTAPITSGMRIGLCHTNGVAPRIGDGPGPIGQLPRSRRWPDQTPAALVRLP